MVWKGRFGVRVSCLGELEDQLECELDLTLGGDGAGDEADTAGDVVARWRQAGGVEDVEEVRTEVQVLALGDVEGFAERSIQIVVIRCALTANSCGS